MNYTRFGFNEKEFDWEVKAWQNQYDYGFRIYDPRIGRFLSTDPLFKRYVHYTPYQFAGNKPIWAVDLDGLEEAKKTTAELPQVNLKKLFDSHKIQEKVANLVYQQLGIIRTRTEMEDYGGKKIPNKIVLGVISEHLIVDPEDGSTTLLDPETKEPSVFFKVTKGVFNFATEEATPILVQSTGVALYKTGELFEKISDEVDQYKKKFYKKYFPDKYNNVSKANTKTVSVLSKTTKFLGKTAKFGGKILNTAGTAQLYYSILDTSPGPVSDDDIRDNVLKELKKFILKVNEQNKKSETKSSVPTLENGKLN